MSLIVDEMGAWSARVPNPVDATKGDDNHYVSVQILGIIDHGRKNPYTCFLNTGHLSDSHLTINGIHSVILRRVKEDGGWHRLPPVLHVQLDNCGRTNKNQKVFAYLAALVHTNVFRFTLATL